MKIIYLKMMIIVSLSVLIYFIWLCTKPVKIIAVHKDQHWTKVLVKNFPLTSRGKVNWWESNKIMLREKYGIPVSDSNGRFSVSFWDFGDGYEIDQPDKNAFFPSKSTDHLLCFNGMSVEARCIRKENNLMEINTTSENLIKFKANGETYYQDDKGKITKGERFTYTIK